VTSIPAGAKPPAPNTFDDVEVVHAVDGDGTALCSEAMVLEQVDGYLWPDVPEDKGCSVCQALIGASTSPPN
jgi:hypothetical protein